jgi:rSAM/selenodomain-associated transferase 1
VNHRALLIMAKAPQGANVKTRLRGSLPDAERTELYRRLLEGTVSRLRDIPGVDTLITYHPPGSEGHFRAFGLPVFPQSGGDLGRRMHEAINEALSRGYRQAALVGVDIPGLDADVVLTAFSLLEESDVVFGPARDGGYYLVGLKSPAPGLFEGVRWSSENTLKDSLERARSLGLAASLAEALSDLDTPEDLRRFPELL